jgi:hypothetical protein
MNIIDPGHIYELDELDCHSGFDKQTLVFVKREGPKFPGNVGSFPGTTTQEVLRACVDRLNYVNNQLPAAETEAAQKLLESAILLLELRAARMHGHTLGVDSLKEFNLMQKCPKCFHIGCEVHKKS